MQGLPGAAQLDMNVSCLFMHEVRDATALFSSLIASFSYGTSTNMVNTKILNISTKIIKTKPIANQQGFSFLSLCSLV
jgi:hypothetical protein